MCRPQLFFFSLTIAYVFGAFTGYLCAGYLGLKVGINCVTVAFALLYAQYSLRPRDREDR